MLTNYAFLWDKINANLTARPHLRWTLVDSTNPRVAYFIQMGRHGIHMRSYISHGDGETPGYAELSLQLGPQDFKIIKRYFIDNPEITNEAPFNKENGKLGVHAHGNDSTECEIGENGGIIRWTAHVTTPPSVELYRHMAPWYVDCLESTMQLLQNVREWNDATVTQSNHSINQPAASISRAY